MIMVEMQNLGSYGGNLGVSRWVAGKYGKGSMEVLGAWAGANAGKLDKSDWTERDHMGQNIRKMFVG